MKVISVKLVLIVALIFLVNACGEPKNKKIVMIDTMKVFEGFEMKKDYDLKMEKDLHSESVLLDSISKLLNNAGANKDAMLEMKLKKDYYLIEKVFNEKFQKLSEQYTSEVNIRLNDYLKEYGKSHDIDFILGTGGQGNIMYVKESNDITNDVLKFVNDKYSK